MSAQHTPGPWIVDEETFGRVIGPHGYVLASVGGVDGYETEKANAYLIAAAPEMLEALKAVEQCSSSNEWLKVQGKVRAAIAKATGAV